MPPTHGIWLYLTSITIKEVPMKRTLIAAALAAVFAATVHAEPRWNEQSLNAAAAQAEAEINEYLQK